jgi:hypothetical protein
MRLETHKQTDELYIIRTCRLRELDYGAELTAIFCFLSTDFVDVNQDGPNVIIFGVAARLSAAYVHSEFYL